MKRILFFNPIYVGMGALAFILTLRLVQPYWPEDGLPFEKNELASNISRSFEKRVPSAPGTQDIITGSTQGAKKPDPAQKKGESAVEAGKAEGEKGEGAKLEKVSEPAKTESAKAVEKSEPQQGETISVPDTITGEKTLLERLAARRQQIDEKEKALGEREALLAAAEQRLEQRIVELKAADGELKATLEAKKTEQVSIKPLVTMYEAMKPKDAARIFEKLQLADLLPIAQAMKPQKLSEILAQLDPAFAGKLTIGMAPVTIARNGAQITNSLPELADLPSAAR